MKRALSLLLIFTATMSTAGSYTGKSKINWISSIKDNQFAISGNWVNKLNCSVMEQSIWYIVSETDDPDEVKAMYSMVISAYYGR